MGLIRVKAPHSIVGRITDRRRFFPGNQLHCIDNQAVALNNQHLTQRKQKTNRAKQTQGKNTKARKYQD